ncbi:CHAP domain-containing protein [Anaerofustis sp. HA2171]|uniref:CHAP domain-containing protein n=1 Tax=Anaerofustis butyriciformans TaxID=3108533 RepID=UPI002E3042B2|nr:CHAP domain-containing protein [Anaerofustis sp. HA2171]
MKKKFIAIILMLFCVTAFLDFPFATVSAKKSTEQQLEEKKQQIENKESDLQDASSEADQLQSEIDDYESKISDLNKKIKTQETKRDKVEKQLEEAQKKLDEAKEKKEKYEEIFAQRMEVMYMYGGSGYLDVIFSSSGLSDLISNISNYKELVTYDQNIISNLQQAEAEIATQTKKIENDKKELDTIIAGLEADKEELNVLTEAKKYQLTDTNESIEAIEEQLDILEKEAIELNDKLYEENIKNGNYSSGNAYYGRGRTAVVNAAKAQIGNYNGDKFWSWYGFNYRVSWCACFVSWCANEAGYIKAGVIPKFSYVDNGANWFRARGRWKGRSYTPSPGDIIFFDWDGNGVGNHVGIVEYVSGGTVHTIEGNTSNMCARRSYSIGSWSIMGYGVPNY